MDEAKAKRYARGDFRQYVDPAEELIEALRSKWTPKWTLHGSYHGPDTMFGDQGDLCGNCRHFKPARGNEYWDGVGVCAIPPSSHRNLQLTDRYGNPVRPIMQFRGAGVFVTVVMYKCNGFKKVKEG